MRHTRAHTANRRSHHALSKPGLAIDDAGNATLRHHMNPVTGMYRGKQIIDVNKKTAVKAKAEKVK